MIACGFVSLGAAVLPRLRGRAEIVLLAGYGLVAGIGYGLITNLWFWPFAARSSVEGGAFVIGGGAPENLAHYAVFYLGTSLGWDLGRGVLTAALVVLGGRRVLGSLRRVVRRAVFAGAAV
jgi:energy-coupling factor transport system substrate-specific component